jgi:hypothetical protein
MEELYKKYYFPSAARFYQILKEHGVKATHAQVKKFISSQGVQQVHKRIIHKKEELLNTVGTEPNDEWEIDLLDYSTYKPNNRNYAWILIAVDVYTRQAHAQPVKTKSPPDVLTAFKKMGKLPHSVLHDDGSEWKGEFGRYLTEHGVINLAVNSKNHTTFGIIDRFSLTLKNTIERIFTAKNTATWVNKLQDIIKNYNSSSHQGILGLTPNEANLGEHKRELDNFNFHKAVENNKIEKKLDSFKIGDRVRIHETKGSYSKGYTANFSKKVYEVVEVSTHGRVKLNNDKIYEARDLILVPADSVSLVDTKQSKAKKVAKGKRLFAREGLDMAFF